MVPLRLPLHFHCLSGSPAPVLCGKPQAWPQRPCARQASGCKLPKAGQRAAARCSQCRCSRRQHEGTSPEAAAAATASNSAESGTRAPTARATAAGRAPCGERCTAAGRATAAPTAVAAAAGAAAGPTYQTPATRCRDATAHLPFWQNHTAAGAKGAAPAATAAAPASSPAKR